MAKLSPEKKREIIELVDKQKKAKLNWVAMITQTMVEDLIENAENLGLIIEEDQILIPTASKELKSLELYNAKREQAIMEILDKRSYRYDTNIKYRIKVGDIRSIIYKMAIDTTPYLIKDSLFSTLVDVDAINLRRVIYPFDGPPVDIIEKAARPYLERMRIFLQQQQDEFLRIYLSIKKYYELLILPLFSHKLTKENQKIILERAEIEEIKIVTNAQQISNKSIFDTQIDKKGFIKELTVRMPDGQLVKVKGNQVKQFIRQFDEMHQNNLRIIFYQQRDIVRELLGKTIQQL